MNSNSKNKLLVWSILILIIINIAVLATIWIMHPKETVHHDTPEDYLANQLQLNNDQKSKLHQLGKAHHIAAEKIKGQIKNARDSFFELLQIPSITDSTKKSAVAKVSKNLERLELLTFDHFKEVRVILNPEQQKKFDEIIQDVLKMIGGPPHGSDNLTPDDHLPPGAGDRLPPNDLPPPDK